MSFLRLFALLAKLPTVIADLVAIAQAATPGVANFRKIAADIMNLDFNAAITDIQALVTLVPNAADLIQKLISDLEGLQSQKMQAGL